MQGNRERIATPPQFRTGVVMVRRPRSQLARLPEKSPSGRPLAITSKWKSSVLGCAPGLQPATGAALCGRRRERARRARRLSMPPV